MMRRLLPVLILLLDTALLSAQEIKSIEVNAFKKPAENPILRADAGFTFIDPIKKTVVQWQKADVFNPAAIVKDGKVYLLYRCEDNPTLVLGGRTSRLGLAVSEDGIHFKKFSKPVLYPDKDAFSKYDFPGGCEDPRLAQTAEGNYVVAYTAWNNKIPRLSIAFSKDLFHWQKKGPAFAKAFGGKFKDIDSKSGAMITEYKNGKPVLAKINGRYWMYWGEHFVNLAWSENLYDWYPLMNADSSLKAVARPRPKKFDSNLTECGPPAIVTAAGIVLFFNGRNATDADADSALPLGTYSVGQMIFDKQNPEKLISRSDSCFLKPSLSHELAGQYAAGTTFSEGLVLLKGRWFLYYGTADSFVGLAISEK